MHFDWNRSSIAFVPSESFGLASDEISSFIRRLYDRGGNFCHFHHNLDLLITEIHSIEALRSALSSLRSQETAGYLDKVHDGHRPDRPDVYSASQYFAPRTLHSHSCRLALDVVGAIRHTLLQR